jgi:hypothetical protein
MSTNPDLHQHQESSTQMKCNCPNSHSLLAILNRPGFCGGLLVLIMQLLSIPADYVRIVPQTLPVEYDRWVQAGMETYCEPLSL